MKRIYIAGPMTKGDYMTNVRMAIDAAHELRELGYLPFIPQLTAYWHMVHPRDYEDWLAQDFAWIEVCDGLLRLPGESLGADREVRHAISKCVPVFSGIQEIVCSFGWHQAVVK